jgi:hypothetical protein
VTAVLLWCALVAAGDDDASSVPAAAAASPVTTAPDGQTPQAVDAKAPTDEQDEEERERFAVSGRLRVETGGVRGGGVVEDVGGVAAVGARLVPRLTLGSVRFRLPVELSHEETPGAALRRSIGEVTLQAIARPHKRLRIELSAGVHGDYRPDWEDPYQPKLDGTLAATSRFSSWDQRAGLELRLSPAKRQKLELKYVVVLRDGREDESFEEILRPTHIPPSDRIEHTLELTGSYERRAFEVHVAVQAGRREDYFQFARDRGTGATHTGAGGAPPNPLQVLERLSPHADGEARFLAGRLSLRGGYALVLQRDVYQGYYSYHEHTPSVRLAYEDRDWLECSLRGEMSLRTYGPDGYAAGPTHPPLESGVRRWDRRFRLTLEVEAPIGAGLALSGSGSALVRRTNYPAYVPGVFPSGAPYDIDWDYESYRATVGITYRF